MISIKKTRHLVWTGVLATAAFAAAAQTPPTPATSAPPAAGAPAPRMERGDPAKRFEQMQQRHAQRLAQLKDKLKLDASQEGAWSSFAAAQQPPARPTARPKREDIAKMTTPQRLDLMQQRQTDRSAAFAKRADATRSFYATLRPDQQQTFDAETMRMMHRGGPGGPGGPGHEGHRPPPPAKG